MATLHDAAQLLLDVSYDRDGCEVALEQFRNCIREEHDLEPAVLELNGQHNTTLGPKSEKALVALRDVFEFNEIRRRA